jgi:putative redox protein
MANQARISFNSKHEGLLQAANGKTNISYKGNGFEPYELLLGGYASCLHATFLGIAKKKRLVFTDVTYDVYSTKREEVPTMLNYVKTTITFTGVEESKQQPIIKSMELAEKYCSISAMINGIADMEFHYEFK